MSESRRVVRCHMTTRPGFHAQYDGWVEVVADPDDHDDVFRAAVRHLKARAFPDYGSSMWRLVEVE